jgi:peptide deformylase
MAILKVARMGHPILRTVAKPIPPGDIAASRVQRLIDDMFETMTEYSGIGLAGPQVHEPWRIFVAGVRDAEVTGAVNDDREMPFMTVINPEITAVGGATDEDWEGCLSIPDIRGRVVRPVAIEVSAYDRTGRRVRLSASGLPARVIQHETDHLDGILFFDRMTSFETLTYMDEYRRHWVKPDDDHRDD